MNLIIAKCVQSTHQGFTQKFEFEAGHQYSTASKATGCDTQQSDPENHSLKVSVASGRCARGTVLASVKAACRRVRKDNYQISIHNYQMIRSRLKQLIWLSLLGLFLLRTPIVAQQSGVSTGNNPIVSNSKLTVGVTDSKAPVIFEDITDKTSLANFKHQSGTTSKQYIMDTASGGVAILDYDSDGRPDIYLLNGATYKSLAGNESPPKAALYHNLGNWKFEDVTDKAGVANERWGMGVAVGDYDNDGKPDIYVSNFGVSRLYHNNGDGTFTDVATKLNVARTGWSTGPSWGDYDGDGRLDLFVPGYAHIDMKTLPPTSLGGSDNVCQFRGVPVMCGPRGIKGEGDTLFHQKADGTFEDVSIKSGVSDPDGFYGFSSAFVHINDDNLLDLIVVNDSTPNQLYLNKGDGSFEDAGYQSGVALNENGREQAGMGLAVGDYDNDGRIDFHITNFSDDTNTLYHNDGNGNFTDVTYTAGLGEVTLPFLGWGTLFIDYDNDGWKDVMVANGHVYPIVDTRPWGTTYAQQPLLFRNLKNGKFARVGAAPGSGLAAAWCSRGMAAADLDGDGKLDLVINNMDSKPTVLKNVTTAPGHWLELQLTGNVSRKSPRDATGAIVFVTANKIRQRQDVVSGGSYASQSDRVLHFGLGSATRVDRVEIKWPSGATEVVPVGKIDTKLVVVEK